VSWTEKGIIDSATSPSKGAVGLHMQNKKVIEKKSTGYVRHPSHALRTGPYAMGKTCSAEHIARKFILLICVNVSCYSLVRRSADFRIR
jgi:SpoVK/Ycf46/Vps4 family AAA+-type ATPase